MWNIHSTTRLLKEMSQSTEPGELVRLFFDHLRGSIDVQRALVLSNAGLSPPQYRLIHNVGSGEDPRGSAATLVQLRQGGLLAELLGAGEFQSIAHFAPDASDPAFDLLQGSGSLMAFPVFEKGISAGMVVLLGSSPGPRSAADLCTLATVSSLLGRAIHAQELTSRLEAACRELDRELRDAADVQRWLLPPSMPAVASAGIAASYLTARRSGGDYYDVGELPDGRLGVLIADVSGKGAAAAVLMAVLRTIVHDEVDRSKVTGPAALLDYADARLCALGLPGRGAFVTAFSGALDTRTGEFTYSSAGHHPPRLLRARQRIITPLDGASTVPLGLLDDRWTHTEESVILMPGDLALLYTDGITDAMSPDGGFFDIARLDQILRDLPEPVTPEAAVEAVARAVARFAGAQAPTDDQTLLALSRHTGPRMSAHAAGADRGSS